jgi:DNA-binding MarR family transcriptional regulator
VTAPSQHPATDIPRGRPASADARFVQQTCRAIVDGRLAARSLARWCKQFELSEAELQALWQLCFAAGGIDQATLANRLALSPAQVSATVERLRARNWLVQLANPHDRRRRVWQLSADGQDLLLRKLADVSSLRAELVEDASSAACASTGRKEAA